MDGYLLRQHDDIVSEAIAESRAQTLRDCAERFERAVHRDWERSKKRIFEELGQHHGLSGGIGIGGGAEGGASSLAGGGASAVFMPSPMKGFCLFVFCVSFRI